MTREDEEEDEDEEDEEEDDDERRTRSRLALDGRFVKRKGSVMEITFLLCCKEHRLGSSWKCAAAFYERIRRQ